MRGLLSERPLHLLHNGDYVKYNRGKNNRGLPYVLNEAEIGQQCDWPTTTLMNGQTDIIV